MFQNVERLITKHVLSIVIARIGTIFNVAIHHKNVAFNVYVIYKIYTRQKQFETIKNNVATKVNLSKVLDYGLITSVDVGRSFSAFKSILADNSCFLKTRQCCKNANYLKQDDSHIPNTS